MPSSMNAAATSSAHPIPSCTARRDSEATTPAPIHPPATQTAISTVICQGSTATTLMKNSACVTTGSAWPTISVPGINSSGTRRKQPKDRRRGRERADAERVEEVGDEPDQQIERRRRRADRSRATAAASLAVGRRHPADDEQQAARRQRAEQHRVQVSRR